MNNKIWIIKILPVSVLSSVLFWDIIGNDLFKYLFSLLLFLLLFNVNGLTLIFVVELIDDAKDVGEWLCELGSCSEKDGGGGGNFKYKNKSLLFDRTYLLFFIYLGVFLGEIFKWKDVATDFCCVWLLLFLLLFNLNPFDDFVSNLE